ncbi:hypothetical protein F383_24704 [Gossypium arboreum]|uniref:Uncharacterized protein n=1 Tax=Gossypium arboreum TaxID=29729 RepID=A0A0B0P7R6_GOSAR|nr:hypothetical protein F383_24704 [Gossypium arboreum]
MKDIEATVISKIVEDCHHTIEPYFGKDTGIVSDVYDTRLCGTVVCPLGLDHGQDTRACLVAV